MILEDYLKNKNLHLETYFDQKIEECKNYSEIPIELRNCECCVRHKLNFPTIGCNIVAFDRHKIKEINVCKCPCRHIARHLCREWELVNEVDDTSSISSTDSSEEIVSSDSIFDFIDEDEGFTKKERKQLDKALQHFKGKKNLRR